MDSLSQIVLGAAVGEVVAGKKLGNRALLWGAVGGTIPDLDVLFEKFMSVETQLAVHRGFSHSIVFSIIAAWLLSWIVIKVYQSAYHRYIAFGAWFFLPAGVVYFVNRIFKGDSSSYMIMGISVVLVGLFIWWLIKRYFKSQNEVPETSFGLWYALFFWSLFTHPLLDSFTTYGTQLFLPFSDYRVAFNAVSVADPIYTIPFLLCVVILSYYHRHGDIRRKLAWAGIGLSSAYLLFCVWNKSQVSKLIEADMKSKGIDYVRYMSSPTILNNILWNCVVEVDGGYYQGYYSRLSKKESINFDFVPHGREILPSQWEADPTVRLIDWFSDAFWIVRKNEKSEFVINDLRYGLMGGDDGDEPYYIFNFPIKITADNSIRLLSTRGGPPPGQRDQMLTQLIKRIKGEG